MAGDAEREAGRWRSRRRRSKRRRRRQVGEKQMERR
jgi:hypothetical protein